MSISWNTGPNRGQSKKPNKKLMKKFHDAWAKKNGYSPQAPKRVGPPNKESGSKQQG